MTGEEIIQQILSHHPEVSRKQILKSLEMEKDKSGGLIAEETLLRLIAARYGVKVLRKRADHRLSISHLVPGLNDVTVAGRVIVVYPPRTFNGERAGKVANLLIADKDDTLRVVLWNDNANSVESGELRIGQVIRFMHGYTREDRNGKMELHLGGKSQIEIEPHNVRAEEYPAIDKFATKISAEPLDFWYYIAHNNCMRTGRPRTDRKPNTSIRVDLDILHQARVAAVTQKKTLGRGGCYFYSSSSIMCFTSTGILFVITPSINCISPET